jgi:hypothetical protein
MDFLKKYDISDEDINIIRNNNYESVINIIIYNKNNVCEVIDYLLSIGIVTSTLSQMLSDRLDLFVKHVDDIRTSFERFNVENLVTIINDDIANLKFL